jgi:hypothetical protein
VRLPQGAKNRSSDAQGRKSRSSNARPRSPQPSGRLARFALFLLGQLWRLVCLVASRARFYWQRLEGKLGKKGRFRLRIAKWVVLIVSPVWLINLAVAFLGHSVVFPLSPFFLREKLSALGSYAAHRPFCLLFDHPEIDPLIARSEARNKLPRGLLAAVVQVESGGRPHRISSAGAMGPAQLMPSTARRLGVSDPFDSTAAVDAAGRLLADHMARFKNIRLAVAAYNAGPGAVQGKVPQNGQTPAYVARVMAIYAARRAAARSRPALSVTP